MPLSIATPTTVGAAISPWHLVLSGLDGVNVGDLTNVAGRKITHALDRPSTFECMMNLHHPLMGTLLTEQHMLIKAYKFGTLRGQFEVSTGELAGSAGDHEVKVVGMDAAYARLNKRLIGRTAYGEDFRFFPTDRGAIMAIIMARMNAEHDSKVRIGSVTPSSVVGAGPWRFKNYLELLNELGDTLNGFDHWMIPIDRGNAPPWDLYGALCIAPLRGATRDETLEYGTDRFNAREYKLAWDTTTRITRAYALPPDWPESTGLPVAHAFDTAMEATAVGRREELIDTDIPNAFLRQALVNEHVSVRKNSRQLLTIQPHVDDGTGRVPQLHEDYDVGDILEARVQDSGHVLMNANVRVYGATIDIDEAGVEQVTLTMIDEESGS